AMSPSTRPTGNGTPLAMYLLKLGGIMFKVFITVAGLLFVLTSGLASCSSEKKTVDVYQASPPQLRTISGVLELDRQGPREVDLQDELDVGNANPAHFKVHSVCRVDASRIQADFEFQATQTVKILELVPEEMLFVDLNQKILDCTFEVNMYNDA